MSLATRTLPGRVEPFRAYFGGGECTQITAIADVADSLGGTYFTLDVPESVFNSATKPAVSYYVWFDNGADPTPAGKTGITVDITTNDSAVAVATAIETALNAVSPKRFRVERVGAVLTVENREMGEVTASADVDSGLTVEQLSAGFGGDIGSTSQDGAEVSFAPEAVNITSLQTGNLILDKFFLGGEISVSLGLQEMDIDTWEQVLKTTGSSYTPAGGTQVAGIGEGTLFGSYLSKGGQLTLKPLSTAAGDNSRNVTFWKCSPQPESINYNNEIQALQVTFTSLLDSSRDVRINAWMFGDQDQDGLA